LSDNPVRLLSLALLISLLAFGIALYTQHALDMQPCPWCILQRIIMLAIAALALLGLLWRRRAVVLAAAAGMAALAVCGIAAALWQHFVASQSSSCKLTLADRIISGSGLDGLAPEIFAARASCADAISSLLGIPYEFWSLATFAVLATLAALALLSRFRSEA
jgi:protein dithiol:quinone oxidoreductase